jgi:hypothetical protein
LCKDGTTKGKSDIQTKLWKYRCKKNWKYIQNLNVAYFGCSFKTDFTWEGKWGTIVCHSCFQTLDKLGSVVSLLCFWKVDNRAIFNKLKSKQRNFIFNN